MDQAVASRSLLGYRRVNQIYILYLGNQGYMDIKKTSDNGEVVMSCHASGSATTTMLTQTS